MTTLGSLEGLLESANLPLPQARAYVAGLELGPATLADIVRRSGLSKTTAFEALDGLRVRKFLRSSRRKKSVVYRMEDPSRVADLLRASLADQAAVIDSLVRAVPMFEALRGGMGACVQMYEGTEALDAYFSALERAKPECVDEVVNADDLYAWIEEDSLLRARKKYRFRATCGRTLSTGKVRHPNPHVEHRRLNPEWGTFHGNVTIFADYICVVTFRSRLITVLIESSALANSLRYFFDVAWRSANDLDITKEAR